MAIGFSTRAIHNGEEPDFRAGASGDVAVPIHLSTTFARLKAGSPTAGYEYTRSLNPTRKALEEKLALLILVFVLKLETKLWKKLTEHFMNQNLLVIQSHLETKLEHSVKTQVDLLLKKTMITIWLLLMDTVIKI